MSLSEPNYPYDYVQARQRWIIGLQSYAQAAKIPGFHMKTFSAVVEDGKVEQFSRGSTVETGDVVITYRFEKDVEADLGFDIRIRISHGSDWSPTLDVSGPNDSHLMTGVYPAWEWAKGMDDTRRNLDYCHKKLAAEVR